VNYAPVSAQVLVQQSDVLTGIADGSSIDPQILAKARAALEHDMAFYALTDEQVTGLYDRVVEEWQSQQKTVPDFEAVDLEITPDASAAAQFIISLLTDQ
jgi:beta-glucosidase/6-phospho-beta-glucosidase/beta-galactosidase